jgi:beta-aspartyl-dipeptidase (metallo-type)
MVKMDFASSAGLPETVQELLQRGHGLETILPCVTCNVADALRLQDKGRLKTGADADLLILDDSGGVRQVMANGRWMVKDGEAIRPGTFE